ncbi:hypothetical protein [Salinimicrobium xinjiangense]|nr:hypothetical protein [Salinimicrobium xinjiangense]
MKISIFKTGCFLLCILQIVACTVDRDDEADIFGTWIETAPVPDRTT